MGITPTASRSGYWLVASDGEIFAFGNAGYYGSIPGNGLGPAGSGLPRSLNAPIVGMVPSSDGGGYFMVASDGGVFAFGDARFEGSCPGIGGRHGAAVAVVPDASGNGYWVVTSLGARPVRPAASTRRPPSSPRPTVGATDRHGARQMSPFGDAPSDGDMSGTRLNGPIVVASGS